METRHEPTPEQRRRAAVTGAVLALLAVAVYFVVVLKFMVNG